MTTQLHCTRCNKMFKVSNATAAAMHRWRAQSGEPFTCGACAGVAEIHETETITVGASFTRDSVGAVGASFTRDPVGAVGASFTRDPVGASFTRDS